MLTLVIIIAIAALLLNYIKKNVSISETDSFDKNSADTPANEPDKTSDSPLWNENDQNNGSEKPNKKTVSNETVYKQDLTQNSNSYADIQFGIIGKPLGHSISKSYFNEMFKNKALKAEYLAFELEDVGQFVNLVKDNPKLSGVNVTIPYKESIIPYLGRLDETASSIGAVNVIKIIRNGDTTELVGYNTDAIGFMESISPLIKPEMQKALILGTGGASKAVQYSLLKLGLECKFVSRNTNFEYLGYYELSPSIMESFLVIVNCTPVGMYPNINECPSIPYSYVSPQHLLYDLIYNPEKTLFLKKGEERRATIKNGYEMWQRQANASWRIWNEQD